MLEQLVGKKFTLNLESLQLDRGIRACVMGVQMLLWFSEQRVDMRKIVLQKLAS